MNEPYFRLQPDREAVNAIRIDRLDPALYGGAMTWERFQQLPPATVAYYQPQLNIEICDFLFAPSFLVAAKFKTIFELLEPALLFKSIQLYPSPSAAEAPQPTYWLAYLPETDCLHSQTKQYDLRAQPRLILRQGAVAGRHLLKTVLQREEIWLASLTAVESILRRQPLGVQIEPVDVKA